MKNKLRESLSHYQVKLLLSFLLCTLLPLSLVGIVSVRVSYSIARDRFLDAAVLAADGLHDKLEDRLRQTEDLADTLQFSLYTLKEAQQQELSSYLDALSLLRSDIALYKSTFELFHISIYLPEEQFGSQEGLYFHPLRELSSLSLSDSRLNQLGASSLWLFRPDIRLPFILDQEQKETDAILCCRALFNQGSQKLDYVYCIFLDSAEFSRTLSATFEETEISCYLLSADGRLAAASDTASPGQKITAEQMDFLTLHTQNCFLYQGYYYYVLPLENGWLQLMRFPESYISTSVSVLLKTLLLLLILALPLTVLAILLVSRSLSGKIRSLSKEMEQFRLQPDAQTDAAAVLPAVKDTRYTDEIDRLGLTFSQMQQTLRQNMDSILQLSLTEERLKYQLLQSQINPHFLYNILGSVRTCLSLNKLDTADRMITDLTRFYRLTLRKSGEMIPLKDELEIASLYLNMEKLCHNTTLDWQFDLEDGIENFMICKFTLQPFLENAILHGISAQTPDILISLSARYGDDTVILTIRDNGIGISPDKLSELQKNLREKKVSYEKHFGICNVNYRISSPLYGNGQINIESTPGCGTTVTIEFAQIEGDAE